MILSAQTIKSMELVSPCDMPSRDTRGNSRGLSACGVDLTLASEAVIRPGEFVLASAREHFTLPNDVVGIIHDKSSLARLGLAVQNTVAEPGWRGYLTLELTNHGDKDLYFSEGDAICQVIFHRLDQPTHMPYNGKYQDQKAGPQEAR